MTKKYEIYKCSICGNIVEVLFEGEGELVCCGEAMELLEEKTEGEHKEWHVPVIEKINDNEILVKVGENPHPMTKEHHIEMIEICCENDIARKYLHHDEKPEYIIKSDKMPKLARAYCNLHGLWKGENHENK